MTTQLRTRTKSRTANAYVIDQFGQLTYTQSGPVIYEQFTDALYKAKRKPCSHSKLISPHSGWQVKTLYGRGSGYLEQGWHNWADAPAVNTVLQSLEAQLPKLLQFDFQKNNGFDLLTTLGELDDTIAQIMGGIPAMFGSYGAVKWGTLPLFSDLKNLWSSLVDLCTDRIGKELNNYLKSKYREMSRETPYAVIIQQGNRVFDFKGKVRDSGVFNLNLEDGFDGKLIATAIFLDEIGFHPDLQVLWELTPLSFVVDWFVPVGQTLDAIHPRGWFTPKVDFFGQRTFKAKCRLFSPATSGTVLTRRGEWSYTRFERAHPDGLYDCFLRTPETRVIFNEKHEPDVQWNAPSLSNWYDTGYIATANRLNKTSNSKTRNQLTAALDILATLGSTQI